MADISKITLPDGNTYNLRDDSKQELLVSGTNIKTVNNNSLLGSGNITIESGGSSTPTTFYGTCSTTASTAAKVVTCDGFELTKGAIIGILFSTANTAATPYLNINSTGAKNISIGSANPNATTNVLKWTAYTMLYFMYDGTYYKYITSVASSSIDQPRGANTWYGTCSTAAATTAKIAMIANYVLTKGSLITIEFTYANTNESPTLNINSTGAKDIVGSNVYWNAGDAVTFIYTGSGDKYLIISKSPISMALSATDDGAGNVTLNMSNISIANGGSF